jgi:Ser/Thr protein kinase RdoA (MazF antagonist)
VENRNHLGFASAIIPSVVGIDAIRTVLRTSWHLAVSACTPLLGGMNSSAWLVELAEPGRRCVAKAVPAATRRQFEAGLAVAERLATCGTASGPPIRTADGALSMRADDAAVALLEYVPGRPLDADDPLDQQWWGNALGAAHRALVGFDHPGLGRFHLMRCDTPHLGVEDWVRPAVTDAVAAMAKLSITDQLTYGPTHGDPSTDSFRLDVDTGGVGIIDWGSAGTGPLVYDIASAVMYAGGPDRAADLVDGYVAAAPVSRDEVEAALPTLLRFRGAVQADYFAYRIWIDDRTGIDDPVANVEGLRHARTMLETA